jgi:hypothetical protein
MVPNHQPAIEQFIHKSSIEMFRDLPWPRSPFVARYHRPAHNSIVQESDGCHDLLPQVAVGHLSGKEIRKLLVEKSIPATNHE